MGRRKTNELKPRSQRPKSFVRVFCNDRRWSGYVPLAAVVLPLSVRESLTPATESQDWLVLVALGAALALRVRLATLAWLSTLFVTPIAFLSVGSVQPRLFHLVAAALVVSSGLRTWKATVRPRWRPLVWPLIWVTTFCSAGLAPFILTGELSRLGGPLNFHLEVGLAFLAGLLFVTCTKGIEIRRVIVENAKGLVLVFLFWLVLVLVVVDGPLGDHVSVREDYFAFPLEETHWVTGIYFLSLLALVVSLATGPEVDFQNLAAVFFLAAALGMTSSRAAALAIGFVFIGFVLATIGRKSFRDTFISISIGCGYVLSWVLSWLPAAKPLHSWVQDFEQQPLTQDSRVSLLREGLAHVADIWVSGDAVDIFFGIGYNQTLQHFSVQLDAHNDLLATFIERGLWGAVLLSIPVYALARFVQTQNGFSDPRIVGGFAGLFTALFLGLTGMASPVFFLLGGIWALVGQYRR